MAAIILAIVAKPFRLTPQYERPACSLMIEFRTGDASADSCHPGGRTSCMMGDRCGRTSVANERECVGWCCETFGLVAGSWRIAVRRQDLISMT